MVLSAEEGRGKCDSPQRPPSTALRAGSDTEETQVRSFWECRGSIVPVRVAAISMDDRLAAIAFLRASVVKRL
jgi:hypothetical protein